MGFFFGTLISADLVHKIGFTNIDKYGEGVIVSGTLQCRVVSGRQVRFSNIVNPSRHKIYFVQRDSPLVRLAVRESHFKLGCGLGVQAYINNVQLIGVACPGLFKTIKQYRDSCPGCLQNRVFFSAKSPYCKSILGQHGPDDLLSATVSQNPLSHLIIDETGPIYFPDPSGPKKWFSAYVLVGVELVT